MQVKYFERDFNKGNYAPDFNVQSSLTGRLARLLAHRHRRSRFWVDCRTGQLLVYIFVRKFLL